MRPPGGVLRFLCALALIAPALAAEAPWKAGLASIPITPGKSMWMAGFGARTKPSEGALHELYVKALALEDRTGRRAVLVTSDLVGFSAAMTQLIADQARRRYGLPRDRLILNSSHTHSGPLLANPLSIWLTGRLSAEQERDVEEYTRDVEQKVVAVVGAALADLRPARLSFGHSRATFGVNRRIKTESGWASFRANPDGPSDPDVPFLRLDSPEGRLRGVVFGYACHTSTLLPDNYRFSGDYAGFAQEWLEKQHPGALALFVAGCGGDIGAAPRGTVELARKHGETLAAAVGGAMDGPAMPVDGPLKTAFEVFPVAFAPPPSRAEFQARLQHKDVYTRQHAEEMLRMLARDGRLPTVYPYPLQVWQFGPDLTLVALAGEAVVDYALRLKKELSRDRVPPGRGAVWVAAYSNDVFAYIPSLRVLKEGGYEGGEATVGARLPGPFAPDIEERIIGKVHELVRKVRRR